jgi:hypothetical protein
MGSKKTFSGAIFFWWGGEESEEGFTGEDLFMEDIVKPMRLQCFIIIIVILFLYFFSPEAALHMEGVVVKTSKGAHSIGNREF